MNPVCLCSVLFTCPFIFSTVFAATIAFLEVAKLEICAAEMFRLFPNTDIAMWDSTVFNCYQLAAK